MSNLNKVEYNKLTKLLRGDAMDALVHRDVALKMGIAWRNEEDLAYGDPFYYEAMVAVLNEKTVSYNRYFYRISNFLESFTQENMEFLDSVFDKYPLPPPGSGWRAIKRFLDRVDGEFRIRCSKYKNMVDEEHLPFLSQLGTILDGPELAEEIWRGNLCLRTRNPSKWLADKQAYILTPEGEFCDVTLTSQAYRKNWDVGGEEWECYEIQGEGNDWDTNKQIENFLSTKATCPYWAKIHWWDEGEMREYRKQKKKSQP